jgi:hypothetical protein
VFICAKIIPQYRLRQLLRNITPFTVEISNRAKLAWSKTINRKSEEDTGNINSQRVGTILLHPNIQPSALLEKRILRNHAWNGGRANLRKRAKENNNQSDLYTREKSANPVKTS